jgi:hypothetical protein
MRALIILVALLAFVPVASACDVCGCSIGGNYFGILPQFHKHFVGFRYSEQSFHSAHSRTAAQKGVYDSNEHFQTLDLIGRFYPVRRIQMLVLAPYHHFNRVDNGVETNSGGLGDISLMASYILLDSGDSLQHRWKHTLTFGGGVKLPTGRSNIKDNEGEVLLENMQPGSGSTDFMLSAAYTLRRGDWGLSSDVLGRLNTTNKNGYHFGNRISGSAKVFYLKNYRKMTLLPNVGLFADLSDASYEGNSKVIGTGGVIALSTLGLDLYFGKYSIGYTYQIPVYQHLGKGQIDSQNRWMATVNYNF